MKAKTSILLWLVAALCGFAQAQPATKMNMRLDWKPGSQHSPLYYAKDKGYYSQEGIDLQIISGSGSSDSVKQLGSRTVDVALVDGLVLVQAAEQRVPIKSIAVYLQRTPITLMSPKSKPVTSVQQLTGDIKLGVNKGSAVYQGLMAMLFANNIKPEQIKMVDVGFGVQPLLVKQVDALMGFTNIQPIELESAGMQVHEIFISDYGVNAYGLTIASNEDFMAKQPSRLAAFLRATKKAVEEISGARQAAVQSVAKAAPEIDANRELKVVDRTLPLWSPKGRDMAFFGVQSEAGWQQTIEVAHRVGLVERSPVARNVFNASFQN
jgi:NitT/TauT family transport system substrate-binding protein